MSRKQTVSSPFLGLDTRLAPLINIAGVETIPEVIQNHRSSCDRSYIHGIRRAAWLLVTVSEDEGVSDRTRALWTAASGASVIQAWVVAEVPSELAVA
jgi:hypothetical protein